ncbi:MAG TPA: hypothetical protein VMM92_09645, partial [Thermoanaerobaculia bacterium]|nr:hypothetical protein [Thermoanaerobaculia bacterium]
MPGRNSEKAGETPELTEADLAELAACTPFWIQAERRTVAWLPMQQEPLREPFFTQSVARFQAAHPDRPAILTPFEALLALSERHRGL